MAIALEFIDVVVPIRVIRAKYPGGWEQCLRDHQNLVGGRVWYDEHLFRDGAMTPQDAKSLVARWASLGFVPTVEKDGQQAWNDLCVVEVMLGGTTLPCEWLEVDSTRRAAHYRGTEAGVVVGRASVNDGA